jgi:hypothetical protein
VRTPDEILKEAGMSQSEFDLLYQAYQVSLSLSGEARDWNQDMEGYARGIGALRESEIVLAKTDLHQAIINRILVHLVTEGRIKGQASGGPPPLPKKKPLWWKFW